MTVTLYLKVTKDRYELPMAVAGSKSELARILGVRLSSICHNTRKGEESFGNRSYVEVEVEDDE